MRDKYYKAYLREKAARLEAENILEEKSRSLYMAKQELIELNTELMGHNRELIKSEKLAALGRLSAGVAHEIKNPLAYMKSNFLYLNEKFNSYIQFMILIDKNFTDLKNKKTQLELKKLISNEEISELEDVFFDINKGIKRISEISSALTGYSHSQKDHPSLIGLNDVILDALKILKNKFSKDIEIVFIQGNVPLLHGAESDFSQVFINIISNAIYSVSEKENGFIKITTETLKKEIKVIIIDNGDGMDQATQDRIYDPFFTTKPVGEGTGLGLYLAFQTISKMKGSIKIKSKINKGTVFEVIIPFGK